MKKEIKSEWKGALKAIFIVAVLCVGVGIAIAAWDDTKITGDNLTAAEWNAQVTDQKNAIKKDGSVAMTGNLNMGGFTLQNVVEVQHGADNSYVGIRGGVSNYCAQLKIYGKDATGGNAARIAFQTINAAKDGYVIAGHIEGASDTPHLLLYYGLKTDIIAEETGGAGVTIDGCLIKDGIVEISSYPDALLLNGTRPMVGNLNLASYKLLTSNLLLKEESSEMFTIRNLADDAYKGLRVNVLNAYTRVSTDEITERTNDHGVDIDGCLIKDGIAEAADELITNDIRLREVSGNSEYLEIVDKAVPATRRNLLLNRAIAYDALETDIIREATTHSGVTVDGFFIKDGYPYIPNHTPSSATEACTPGQLCYDSNYTYVCIATDTWERAALSSW